MKPIIALAAAGLLLATGVWIALGQEQIQSSQLAPESPAQNQPDSERDFRQPVREPVVGDRITSSRAFLGAPPPIPHSIDSEMESKSCLQCHATENRVEKRQQAIAPVPHAEFSQCLHCHVKGAAQKTPIFKENDFLGLDFPGKGSRTHAFAPPTIPHKTFLRENCLACHGPSGDHGNRTAHPDRSQCLQCHVPEASSNYDRPLDRQSMRVKL